MVNKILENLFYGYLMLTPIKDDILNAYAVLEKTYENGGKVLCCGNGGSCADADHIVGELMKNFVRKRPIDSSVSAKLRGYGELGNELAIKLEGTLPAISLNSQNALTSAYINDSHPYMNYAQILYGLGNQGDTLITLTTSGNSKNCLYAATAAKAKNISVIAFTGADGGKIKNIADITIKVPESETYRIQELHLPIYHCLCLMLEERFFASPDAPL